MSDLWKNFDRRFGLEPLPPGGKPVFLMASGWRCGSTLLQRLLVSSGELLVWGEPYGRAGIIPAMTRSAICFREDWPVQAAMAPSSLPDDLHTRWIANLYPDAGEMRASFRAQLDTFLAAPAEARGYGRFGLKEVRLQALDGHFLQWIYPDARFIFLVRNPWSTWASGRGGVWWNRWPTEKVVDAVGWAKHWRRLVQGFIQWPDETDMLVRYEDLVRPSFDLSQVAEHASLSNIDSSVRDNKVRGITNPPSALPEAEVKAITEICGELTELLGYETPS